MATLVQVGTGASYLFGKPRRRKTASERRDQHDRAEGRRVLHLLRCLEGISSHRGSDHGAMGNAVLKALQAEGKSAQALGEARRDGGTVAASGGHSVAPEEAGLPEHVGHAIEIDSGFDSGLPLTRGAAEVTALTATGIVEAAVGDEGSKGAGPIGVALSSGVLVVLRRLRSQPGGVQAVADVTAWVAAPPLFRFGARLGGRFGGVGAPRRQLGGRCVEAPEVGVGARRQDRGEGVHRLGRVSGQECLSGGPPPLPLPLPPPPCGLRLR